MHQGSLLAYVVLPYSKAVCSGSTLFAQTCLSKKSWIITGYKLQKIKLRNTDSHKGLVERVSGCHCVIATHSYGNQEPIKIKDWFSHFKEFCMCRKPAATKDQVRFKLVTLVNLRSSDCELVIPNQSELDELWSNYSNHGRGDQTRLF